ncbi:helix-turn-helix domain-containing protein [Sporosarcina sp. Te-1]|uniref:helix-turn-helix domain-containing protein n=1 Tax=Sporosarcina sp. Te-1 TaxID=2818390 RepID=UPI001A9E7D0C|nr:Rgg/GadR/MutR family transcriptional regulator [Sporosarcina sp. Te-1]QTD42950.1 helix-turn-helix domain-containing protein [Sporosarcina sp. Te-1]
MKKYGVTVRKIREQKGYTLQQLSSGILSVSFLSKFERGESDISLGHMSHLLEKLFLTFEEFFYLHEGVGLEQIEYFFDKAREAYVNRDLEQLRQLREVALDKWETHDLETFRCSTLMLDVYEGIISNQMINSSEDTLDFLYTYLFDVEVWGYYELRLYNSTMFLMPPEMIMKLSKIVFEKSQRYRNFKEINKVIIAILMNTLTYLLAGSTLYVEQYKVFLGYLESLNIPEDDLYTRNSLLQIKGNYEIKIGNREKGIEMVKKAISIYTDLGSRELAATAENYLRIVLGQT